MNLQTVIPQLFKKPDYPFFSTVQLISVMKELISLTFVWPSVLTDEGRRIKYCPFCTSRQRQFP